MGRDEHLEHSARDVLDARRLYHVLALSPLRRGSFPVVAPVCGRDVLPRLLHPARYHQPGHPGFLLHDLGIDVRSRAHRREIGALLLEISFAKGYLKIEGILIIAGSLNKLKRNGSILSCLSGPPRLNSITAFFIKLFFP